MRREELELLANLHGIDLSQVPAELADADLEAVVGGMQGGTVNKRGNGGDSIGNTRISQRATSIRGRNNRTG